MILKRTFHPVKVWAYIQNQTLFALLAALAAWLLWEITHNKALVLPFAPVAMVGSAVAIFVAFRNQSAYSRWWEARTLWGGIVNSSRVLGRLVVTFTDSHAHQAQYDRERSERFKTALVYKQIAWVHALRLQLRGQTHWHELEHLLGPEEYTELLTKDHKANHLHLMMGRQIYAAMADGTLGGFDSFQLEGQLLALANYQGGAERIKNTPLPRQYDFFTRMFVLLLAAVLPFGLLGLFIGANLEPYAWCTVPVSVVLSGMFIIMERTGAANEDPFENKVTDVALTAICNTIERNLREMLGETNLPAKLEPVNGYLF